MKEFDYKKEYQECIPEELHINDIGWSAFLGKWNDEGVYWVKKTLLVYGVDPFNHRTSEDWMKYLENIGLSKKQYFDLKTGGMDYPPKTNGEVKRVENWLDRYRNYIVHDYNYRYKKKYTHDDLINNPEYLNSEDGIVFRNSLMFSPATDSSISEKENQLGVSFPDSYKEFLKVSNGWTLYDILFSKVEDITFSFDDKASTYLYWEVILSDTGDNSRKKLYPGDPVPQDQRSIFYDEKHYERYEFERSSILISKPLDVQKYQFFNPYRRSPNGDWLGMLGLFEESYPLDLIPFTKIMEYYYRRDIAKRCIFFKQIKHFKKTGKIIL